jgi:hypothetical protein
MTIIPRRGLKKDGASIAQVYKDYHKEHKDHITKKDYERIVEAVHKKTFDKMCEREYSIQLSHSIGTFYLHCFLPLKQEHKIIDNRLSKQYKKDIYFKNSHSDGKRIKIKHRSNIMLYALNGIFRFRMCRNLNRLLAKRILSKEIPLWT